MWDSSPFGTGTVSFSNNPFNNSGNGPDTGTVTSALQTPDDGNGYILANNLVFGIFRPTAARFVAPLYALAEGLALGALTALYATGSKGVAPLAIVFTAAVFVGALVVFRSGFVKVTPRFVSMTIMAGFGFLAVLFAGLFGLFPGLSSQTGLLVIGVIAWLGSVGSCPWTGAS